MKRKEREWIAERRWWFLRSGTYNSWWHRAQERGWDWEAEDTYLDCLADMVDRIADLEERVKNHGQAE
jgi:hypothetical protein